MIDQFDPMMLTTIKMIIKKAFQKNNTSSTRSSSPSEFSGPARSQKNDATIVEKIK